MSNIVNGVYVGGCIGSYDKREKEYQKLVAELPDHLTEDERLEAMKEIFYRKDEDTILALDWRRDDDSERYAAFVEAVYEAINTDEEPWTKKGYAIWKALVTNNAEQLLIALCGWGANSIAKRALLVRDDVREFYPKNIEGELRVFWKNGRVGNAKCKVNPKTHQVYEYGRNVFEEYKEEAEIEKVYVTVCPICSDKGSVFLCMPKKVMKKHNDEAVFWY